MKQIGARNRAKMVGGLGRCGRELCCALFLQDFDPITVRMAKDQGLSLDPTKISGVCGRLMCCLGYEHETYCACKKALPKCGKKVVSEFATGKVTKQDILRQKVWVKLDSTGGKSKGRKRKGVFSIGGKDIIRRSRNAHLYFCLVIIFLKIII